MIQLPAQRLTWLALLLATPALAEDVVRLENNQKLAGEIVAYDDESLAIRLPGGREIRRAASEVRSVETAKTEAQRLAEESLARRDLAEASRQFEKAIEEERRGWMKDRLRVQLIATELALGHLERAGELFLKNVEGNTEPVWFRAAPLAWRPGQQAAADNRPAARRWMDDSAKPIARLLGASWLLDGPDRENAVLVLSRLQTDPDQRVSYYARAQLWRLRGESATREDLARYAELVGKIPAILRAGPRYVLALATDRLADPADAALIYTKVAYIDRPSSELAADALVRAAACCQRAGFHDDAAKLNREVVKDYPGTQWAAQASERLAAKGAVPTKSPTGNRSTK